MLSSVDEAGREKERDTEAEAEKHRTFAIRMHLNYTLPEKITPNRYHVPAHRDVSTPHQTSLQGTVRWSRTATSQRDLSSYPRCHSV